MTNRLIKRKDYLYIGYFVVLLCLTIVRILFSTTLFDMVEDTNSLFTVFAQLVCMGLVPIVFVSIYSSENNEYNRISDILRVGKRTPLKLWVVVIVLSIIQLSLNGVVSSAWSDILASLGYKTTSGTLGTNEVAITGLISDIIMTGILPPIFEELTHRGLVMSMVDDGRDTRTLLLSAMFFAFMHQNIAQLGHTFVGGIFFGAVALWTGDILTSMVMHAINNCYVVICDYSNEVDGIVAKVENSITDWFFDLPFWLIAVLVGVIVLIGIGGMYYLYRHRVDRHVSTDKGSAVGVGAIIGTIVLGLGVALFTLVWGIIR